LHFPSNRPARDSKSAIVIIRSHDGIFIFARAEEDAIVDPLGLNELELTTYVGSHKSEHESTIDTIVFQYSLGQ